VFLFLLDFLLLAVLFVSIGTVILILIPRVSVIIVSLIYGYEITTQTGI